jgi:hypothetical protein
VVKAKLGVYIRSRSNSSDLSYVSHRRDIFHSQPTRSITFSAVVFGVELFVLWSQYS